MWCDLHLHSHHSDGEFAPAAVIDMAADAGVELASLTDHDTTAGLAEAAAHAAARGMRFVGGIEMTAYAYGRVVHVLGLGISAGSPALESANRIAMDVWGSNQRRWVRSLAATSGAVSEAGILGEEHVRLPVLIERLCRAGVDDGDPRRCYERFKRFFAELDAEAYAPLRSPAATASAIRAAGGIAILAHPARLEADGLAEQLLADLDGIEAMYAPYEPPARDALLALARRHGKLHSCGSDYHGFFSGPYVNPRFAAPRDLLDRLAV